MFMLIVEFEIKPECADQFETLVLAQADNSLMLEPDCHFFHVKRKGEANNLFVLSEVYTNADAFQQHLESKHFLEFDARVSDWGISKSVRSLE